MADISKDDLNRTAPSVQDEKNVPSEEPREDTATEEIRNSEDVLEDEQINDRFQATDN